MVAWGQKSANGREVCFKKHKHPHVTCSPQNPCFTTRVIGDAAVALNYNLGAMNGENYCVFLVWSYHMELRIVVTFNQEHRLFTKIT